jgi:anaerobic ribonucleoside-triphosphate reductase
MYQAPRMTFRKELQEAFAVETQRKRDERLKQIDFWVERDVYNQVKLAAIQGKVEYQWNMPNEVSNEEEYNHYIEKLRHFFPDCDIDIVSYQDFKFPRRGDNRKCWISWK